MLACAILSSNSTIGTCDVMPQGEPPEEEQLDISYANVHRVVTSLGSPGYHPAFAGQHLAELQVRPVLCSA
jgi:hypothetical protein